MIGAVYAAPQYKSYDAPAKPSYGAPSKALKARCEFPNGGGLLNIIETNLLPKVVTPSSTSLKPPPAPNIETPANVNNIKLPHNVTYKFNLNDHSNK